MSQRVRGDTLISETTIATATSEVVNLDTIDGYAMQVTYTDTTPSALTFDSDQYEVQTLTYDTKANSGHQDFVVVEDTTGLTYAVALTKPGAEVQTLTFPDKATAANGDYVVVEDTVGTQYAVALTKPIAEVQTLTYADAATSAHQDFIVVEDTTGLSYAIALTKPVAEVQTLTFPAFAGITDADYIVVEDTAAVTYAVYADKTGTTIAPTGALYVAATHKVKADISADTTAAQVAARFETAFNTLTGFTAAITTDDTAADGTMTLTQAIKAPVTNPVPKNEDDSGAGSLSGAETTPGVASVGPSGAIWTAIAAGRKGVADISGDTTAAQVAARAETAWNLLTGFTAAITSDDTAADGTMTFTHVVKAPVVNPVPKDAAETGAGTILGVETTAGIAAQTPTGAAWTAATYKGLADLSSDTTAAQVAARAETALNALTGFTAAITSDDSAANGTMTLTQGLKAPVDNPVPKSFDDGTAGTITGVQTTGGVASVAPSGAIWTAIASARKGLADISGDTTAAQVAARAETAWNLLTGFTAAITSSDAAANGTMTFTQTVYGPVTNPVPKDAAESGAGSITGVQTTAGQTSEVSEGAENAVSITAHGMATGLKGQLTTSGTLPAGLALATDYYIIVVDANTVQFATSLALAQAGTAVDITDEGIGVHTFTATALSGVVVKLQASNDGTNYEDLSGSTVTISAAGTKIWNHPEPFYRYVKVVHTPSVGAISLTVVLNAKADQ